MTILEGLRAKLQEVEQRFEHLAKQRDSMSTELNRLEGDHRTLTNLVKDHEMEETPTTEEPTTEPAPEVPEAPEEPTTDTPQPETTPGG